MQINTKNYNPPPSEILILEFAIYTLQVKKTEALFYKEQTCMLKILILEYHHV